MCDPQTSNNHANNQPEKTNQSEKTNQLDGTNQPEKADQFLLDERGCLPRIIGISGKMGSGKDTVAGIIAGMYPGVYRVVTFADKVREVVEVLTGMTPDVSQTVKGKGTVVFPGSGNEMTCGKLQQLVGNGLRDILFNDLWIYLATVGIGEDERVIITDVRYPNEVEYIQSHGGIVIRLIGDPSGIRASNPTGRDLNALSETALDNYPISKFHTVIANTSTLSHLYSRIKEILSLIQHK